MICTSYGGPGSQKVDVEYRRDWHDYLVCTLQYVVVVVDGRGTGFKGRQLRNPIRYNMGFWETRDQINTARCVLGFFFPILSWPLKVYFQHLGWQGLRRPKTHWHMGLGKRPCTVIHPKLSCLPTFSLTEGSWRPRSPRLMLESTPWQWPSRCVRDSPISIFVSKLDF